MLFLIGGILHTKSLQKVQVNCQPPYVLVLYISCKEFYEGSETCFSLVGKKSSQLEPPIPFPMCFTAYT